MKTKMPVLLGCAATLLLASWVTPVAAKLVERKAPPPPPPPVEEEQPLQTGTVKMFEWGVQRENWDGSKVSPNDVPDFYYSADEVPIGELPVKPLPDPDPGFPDPDHPTAEKPVIYFECDKDVTFDFTVSSTVGAITWMYPKPNRRLDDKTAQWDKLSIYPDGVKRAAKDLPGLHAVTRGHWSEFSRDGATSTVVVNGEAERFLFYEAHNTDLVEVDVAQNDKGEIILRNFCCQPVHDLRLRLKVKDQWRAWFVRQLSAASGDVPSEVKLGEGDSINLDKARAAGSLAAEARAAGLSQAQANVFERCWADDFLKGDKAVMTYRLDQELLDENFVLSAGLPRGMALESKRVGYKWIGAIDLSKQAELDKWAASAATGDKDAAENLKKAGISGVGAVRRASLDKDRPLRQRINLAQLLKSMSGK